MPDSFSPITYADFAALATLANSKLSPSTAYAFPPFAGNEQISSPNKITSLATYGGTGAFAAGSSVPFWLFPYRTISGLKTYSYVPITTDFTGVTSSGAFALKWTWTNPSSATAPEGYIAVIPFELNGGFQLIWKDIGLVSTLTEDGSFSDPAWKFDQTLDQNNPPNGPTNNLPCGHGAWLKPLNQIHSDLFKGMDLFGGSSITFDPSFLLSGPWCVSAGPKCYLYINSTSIYKNLQFWYSVADSATGNELAPEAEFLNSYTGGVDGVNSLNWSQNVTVNGRMVLLSSPNGQNASDWTLSASPGITPSFDANYFDPVNGFVTALIFDFDAVTYSVGTPLTITATPTAGGHIINSGNPAGGGLSVNCTFTGDSAAYTDSDVTAIHYAGKDAKSAALPNSLPQITFTTGIGGSVALDSHFKAFCNGVYVANTLPTLGAMPYLDQDLPQYSPSDDTANPSSRRTLLSNSLPPIPHVDNRGALYPIFRDTDFTPDNVGGQALNGSKAWQGLGTKFVSYSSNTGAIPPSPTTLHTTLFFLIAANNTLLKQLRFYFSNPSCTLYVKAGAPPTLADYDFAFSGGFWGTVPYTSSPTATVWYVGILNNTGASITATTYAMQFNSITAPNGSFFPVVQDDAGDFVPQHEGYSFHWWNNTNTDLLPIPQRGYCVDSITISRQPVDNGSGILIAPSTGTSSLNVDIGLMQGWGFESAGTFQKIQTVTIPAGESSATSICFLPVLSGTPIAYQSVEQVQIRCAVNFQPQMHSSFDSVTVKKAGSDYSVGYFDGAAFYNPDYALLAFVDGDKQQPIVLPVSAVVYNDLQTLLELLP